MVKAVMYSRVSTDEEKQLNALEKQVQELTDYISRQDEWILIDSYVDEGKSGTRTKGRKQYERLFNDLESDKFDVVVVKDISRLMRNLGDFCKFIDKLQINNKRLFLYLDNKFYVPEDKFITGIKAMMAEEYSRDLSRKINSAAKRAQKNGTVYSNGLMLGYNQKDGKLTINEDEAVIVRQIFQWYIDGLGFQKISNKLDEMGIKSSTGTKFSQSTLKRMIRQEKYRGMLVSGKFKTDFETHTVSAVPDAERIYIEGGCPRIVSDEIWFKANECLDKRRKENGMYLYQGVHANNYPLTNKIYCGKCGKQYWHNSYTTKVNKLHRSVWNCSTYKTLGIQGCKNTILQDEVIMKLTKEVIFDTVTDDGVKLALETLKNVIKDKKTDDTDDNDINSLVARYQKVKNKKNSLLDLLLEETISKEQYETKCNEINNQLKSINELIEKAEKDNATSIMSAESRIKAIEEFINSHYDSAEHITDVDVKNMVDKIVVNDNNVDIYLSSGESKSVNLYSIKGGKLRSIRHILYQTRKRRTKKRDSSNWLYFNVYFVA